MRILVTGGAGFIGSHVAHILHTRGHTVSVIDDLSGGYRRNAAGLDLHEVDLVDHVAVNRVFAEVKPHAVAHCAAYAAEGLSHWMRRYNYTQNLVAWANLANAVLENGVERVMVCSSMAVYGSQLPPFDEALLPQPEDPYGAAKAALEADVKSLGALFGVEWNIARPHNVYGPRQNLADPYRNVVAIFMKQALSGQPITVYGSGKQTRAFSYIADVAPVIADLTDGTDHGLTVNIGGEQPISILDLAYLIQESTWSTSTIRFLPERHEVVDAYSDHRVLRELYGSWDPTGIEEGVAMMAEWARGVEWAEPRRYDYETEHEMFGPWRSSD